MSVKLSRVVCSLDGSGLLSMLDGEQRLLSMLDAEQSWDWFETG
jgi:hypothetical protein